MRHLAFVAALAFAFAGPLPVATGTAAAQSCSSTLPPGKRCLGRTGDILDQTQSGIGGPISCAAEAPDWVQRDVYTWTSSLVYICTMYLSCSQASPAEKAAFC